MSPQIEKIGEQLENIFRADKAFINRPNIEKKSELGKVGSFEYSKIQNFNSKCYVDHITSTKHLTPVPIMYGNYCTWGAIDIDNYKLTDKEKINIINKAHFNGLIPCHSKSGGFHLFGFAAEMVPASLMVGRLRKVAFEVLGLPKNTEIFPKQTELNDGDTGNGITIPYRSYFLANNPFPHCVGLYTEAADPNKVLTMKIGQFFGYAARYAKGRGLSFHQIFENYCSEETQQLQQEAAAKDSMQDPKIRKLSASDLLEKIKKEDMKLSDAESFFDDTITLAVGKLVAAAVSDQDIKQKIFDTIGSLHDRGCPHEYLNKKIAKARAGQQIDDPELVLPKLLESLVYIKKHNSFFDRSTNDQYDKEAVNFTYGRYNRAFKIKGANSLSGFLMSNPKRIVVEDYVYRPQSYNADNPIIIIKGKKYINTYRPTDLKPAQGDITLWNELLKHIFNDQQEYIDQFLDWITFQIQNPGIKIRYAVVIVTTQFQMGKSSLFRAIRECLGSHNVKVINVKEALDKSKGYLTDSQLVLIDEMKSEGNFSEREALLNNLKQVITEDFISSRKLYEDYRTVETISNYILFTNNTDALSLPRNEQRYWVYINKNNRLSEDFYKRYHAWLDQGGAAAILYYLQNRTISTDFNPKAVAPKTPFLDVMSVSGSHPLTQLVQQLYEEQQEPFEEGRDVISSTDLFNWFKESKQIGKARVNDIVRALEVIGARPLGQCRFELHKKIIKPSLYVIRNHERYQHMSNQEIADKHYSPLRYANQNGII